MLNLIRIELLKLKRRSKFIGILVTLILSSLIILPVLYSDEKLTSWNAVILLSFALISLITNVFTCILSGELFMEEYRTKTINIMFTYPISRTKIYFSKLLVMSLYCLIISIVGAVIFLSVANIANYIHPALTDSFTKEMIIKILVLAVFYSIFNSFVSIVYSFFSTVKISIPLMVVSCILILNATSNNDITELSPYALIPLAIVMISSALLFPIIRHLNIKDVV
ncbi:ABC transporter permease [Clostridium sp. YIM B02505]|uniref:ABC transporter permease n=1 Tax=Clostridium yunnanense TaxID=2800325 RepID=A0ABS1EVQ3_9CLOT|nr:ABC transporter permease [Clostridium yunnanense]MBK1813466.1 ABC transporter permease [Clostridium yunnanense]